MQTSDTLHPSSYVTATSKSWETTRWPSSRQDHRVSPGQSLGRTWQRICRSTLGVIPTMRQTLVAAPPTSLWTTIIAPWALAVKSTWTILSRVSVGAASARTPSIIRSNREGPCFKVTRKSTRRKSYRSLRSFLSSNSWSMESNATTTTLSPVMMIIST